MTITITGLCTLCFPKLILVHHQVVCIACNHLYCLLDINPEKAMAWDESSSRDLELLLSSDSENPGPSSYAYLEGLNFGKAHLPKPPREIAFSISFPHLLQEQQDSPLDSSQRRSFVVVLMFHFPPLLQTLIPKLTWQFLFFPFFLLS